MWQVGLKNNTIFENVKDFLGCLQPGLTHKINNRKCLALKIAFAKFVNENSVLRFETPQYAIFIGKFGIMGTIDRW
jgi:hypothetical protein